MMVITGTDIQVRTLNVVIDADVLQHPFEEGGGDDFQLTPAYYASDYDLDIVDLLVPSSSGAASCVSSTAARH